MEKSLGIKKDKFNDNEWKMYIYRAIKITKDYTVQWFRTKINQTFLETNTFLCKIKVKKISNDQELIQSDPISCPQNQKGNNYINT